MSDLSARMRGFAAEVRDVARGLVNGATSADEERLLAAAGGLEDLAGRDRRPRGIGDLHVVSGPVRMLVVDFVVEGNPVPWRRIIPGRGRRAYLDPVCAAEEERIGLLARAAGAKPREGRMELEVAFYRSTRHQIDGDNLQKLVMDALNGVAWVDDTQVDDWHGRKRYDRERPRTEIRVWRIDE